MSRLKKPGRIVVRLLLLLLVEAVLMSIEPPSTANWANATY